MPGSATRANALDHVVVVLFENRSLDNVLGRLYGPVSGLFLGRFAHQVAGLAAVLDDALDCVARTPAS